MRGPTLRRQQAGGADPICVSFGLQYGDELSQAETNPMVSCYFSRPVEGSVVDVSVPEDDASRTTQVRLEGVLKSGTLLPADTKIVFYATCERLNDFGVPCRVTAGIGMVDLSLLANSANSALQLDVPLTMPSAGNMEKGKLRITTTRRQVDIGTRIRWEAIGGNYAGAGRQTPVEAEMITYINNIMRTEMAMPNTFSDTANVRIPVYYSDIGLLNREAPLPAAAYFMCQVPKSNRLFWTNALEVVLAREGQVVHDVDRMSLQEQAKVMADINCLLVQGLDYISDTVDQNKRAIAAAPGFIGAGVDRPFNPSLVENGENFGDALAVLSGDCEDFGLCIGAQVFEAFLEADFADHAQLKRLQEIGNQYICMMTLDSVMGAAVNDGKRKLGAHIKANFLPALWVKERMDKAAQDLSSGTAKIKGRSLIGNAVAEQTQLPWKGFAPWADKLEVLIAEGTGAYETRDRAVDPLHTTRVTVDQAMPSLRGMKKPLVHTPGSPSQFFVGSMVGFTSYFLKLGANVGGMWLGYTQPGSATFQRGIEFHELVGKSNNISMLSHPPFSDGVKTHMERALRIRIPPRDLILTPEGIAAQPERCEKLDEIAAFTAKLGRTIPQGGSAAPFYIRSHQLVPETVKAIKTDIQRSGAITGLAYVREPITDYMSIYRTGFFTK